MDGLALLGIIISTIVMAVLYVKAWSWTITILNYESISTKFERILAKTFIGLHILAILAWFVWSWIYLF